jgi:2-isopropylmalate synthase
MAKDNRIIIFDTTLRDGEQSPGASMLINQKIEIALMLQKLKVDIIEAGFAFASQQDFDSITQISKVINDVTICSLARATQKDIDAAFQALQYAKNKRIHTFVATSDIHLKYKLNKTREQILEIIHNSVKYARNLCDNIEWSAEDATRTDIDYLIQCVDVAIKAGATTINLPDTVGFSTPTEYGIMFEKVISSINADNIIFSTHCHNDLGMATANAFAGIAAGAKQVECTINGIGERAGNTALEEIVMILKTRKDFNFETNINTEKIQDISKAVQKVTGLTVQANKAIVGRNAFLHESGIHQDGVLKNKSTYELIKPEDVGIKINPIVLGRLSGRAALKDKLKEFGCNPNNEELSSMFNKFKEVAANKKFILDTDIIDIIHKNTDTKILQIIEFISYQIFTSNDLYKQVLVKLMLNGKQCEIKQNGNGVIDATYQAINKIAKINPLLYNFGIDAISNGSDATAIANVVLLYNESIFCASACDNDIIFAAAKAYVACINKILNQKSFIT